AVLLAATGWACGDAYAEPASPGIFDPPADWIDWNGDNFFGPCRGDCSFSLYGGKEVATSMERIFFVKSPPAPIWRWHWRNTGLIAGDFSRRLVTIWKGLNIEPEFGLAQRFGEMHATEF